MAIKSKLTKEQEKKLARLVLDELVSFYRGLANRAPGRRVCLCTLLKEATDFRSLMCGHGCPAHKGLGRCWGPGGAWRMLMMLNEYDHTPAYRTVHKQTLKKFYRMTITQARAHARKKANAWKKWALKRI